MSRIIRCAMFASCLLQLFGCGQSASEYVFEEFTRVNKGLERSVDLHDSTMFASRASLMSAGCANELVVSDSIRTLYRSISLGIDTLKSRMLGSDPDNYIVADSAYALNGTGDRLHHDLVLLFDQASHLLKNDPLKTELTYLGQILQEPPPPETWRIRNFYFVPAVAANTVLSVFRANAARAEALCINKLLRDCDGAE